MKNLNVRMPDDLHVSLRALAERDHRSLNAEIVHLLSAAVAAAAGSTGGVPHDR